MIIQTISDIIQSAFNMGLETVELSTGWYIILYIACLQLIKGTSVVISINKLVMIINVYDTLAKGCQHYLKKLKTIHIKSHNIEKNPFLYYLIQIPVHVYSNYWNNFNQIFNTPTLSHQP